MKFYKCRHCGNIIHFMNASGLPVTCCGEQMEELIPGTSDGAAEKHVPVIIIDGSNVTVKIGEVDHPMIDTHYIEWIILETKKGFQEIALAPGDAPKAEFLLTDGDEAVATYAYCNLHSLWATSVS